MPTPDQILAEATALVSASRAEQHGDYKTCHEQIARLWSAHLGTEIEAQDVALMMILVKLARAKVGGPNPDNYVDMCGYAAIAGAL